jgi:hypothetical protein
VSRPFGREDARKRAEMARNAVESYRGALRDRQAAAVDPWGTDDDRAAARACVALMQQRIAFELAQADGYDRISRGEAL